MPTDSPLHAEPIDHGPDLGPRHRGGPLVTLAALVATLAACFAAGVCIEAGRAAWAAPSFLLLAAPAAWWWRCVWVAHRRRHDLPRSAALLAGELGFEIVHTCHGVAGTAFFYPDHVAVGETLRLLVFLENYTSRQRVATILLGPHPGLGLDRPLRRRLHLAPGQAAVYCLPIPQPAGMEPGPRDLPGVLRVACPTGVGLRLPGARLHNYDIGVSRLAIPFTIDGQMPAPAEETFPECYLSLASGGVSRLPDLQNLLASSWMRIQSAGRR